jgi:hypothetical protein
MKGKVQIEQDDVVVVKYAEIDTRFPEVRQLSLLSINSIDCATELSSSINKTRMSVRFLAASGEATAGSCVSSISG